MKKALLKETHYKLDSLFDLVQARVTSFKNVKHHFKYILIK